MNIRILSYPQLIRRAEFLPNLIKHNENIIEETLK